MKIVLILMVCGLAAAVPKAVNPKPIETGVLPIKQDDPKRDLMDQLLPIVFEFIRLAMRQGYPEMGIPVLDPLNLDALNINVPAGLINLNLDLEGVYAEGLSDFVLNRVGFDIIYLIFTLDLCLPRLYITAEKYDLLGDLFTALPLYGKGTAKFLVKDFCFTVRIHLDQSEDERSIIIGQLEDVRYDIPFLESELTGAIGGGDIDNVVNAVINEVIIGYLNRFERFISAVITSEVPKVLNPILNRLDSWEFIDNYDRTFLNLI